LILFGGVIFSIGIVSAIALKDNFVSLIIIVIYPFLINSLWNEIIEYKNQELSLKIITCFSFLLGYYLFNLDNIMNIQFFNELNIFIALIILFSSIFLFFGFFYIENETIFKKINFKKINFRPFLTKISKSIMFGIVIFFIFGCINNNLYPLQYYFVNFSSQINTFNYNISKLYMIYDLLIAIGILILFSIIYININIENSKNWNKFNSIIIIVILVILLIITQFVLIYYYTLPLYFYYILHILWIILFFHLFLTKGFEKINLFNISLLIMIICLIPSTIEGIMILITYNISIIIFSLLLILDWKLTYKNK